MTTQHTDEEREMARQFGHEATDIYPKQEALNDGGKPVEKKTERVSMAETDTTTAEKIERWRNRLMNAIKKFMATQSKAIVLQRLQKMLDDIQVASDINAMNKVWMKSTVKIPLADDVISDDELEAMLTAEIDTLGEQGTPITPVEGEDELPVVELPVEEPLEEEITPKSEIDQLIEDLQALIDNEELALEKDAVTEVEETIAGLEETRAAITVAKEVIEKNSPEVTIEVEGAGVEV